MTDFELMGLALEEAAKAAALGEVPVGAVVARHGEVVATAHNTRETEKNALHHAELLAIDAACKALGGWRLWECELFVTLEPCPMCAGGIINSRLRRVVYGAADTKAGCCGSVTDLFALPFNHHPVVEKGLREAEAQQLLQAIFCFPAGKAGGQTPLEAPGARKQGKIRKNSGNCVKNCSSHFLFGLDCGILFNGILSKPIATAGRHAKAPDLCRTHKRNAALSGDGHRVFPAGALRPAENTEQEGYTLVRGRV